MEMPTSTTWTVRNLVALPAASRARGSFMTRRRNCGQTTSDQMPATIRTSAAKTGSSTRLVAFQPGLCLLGLQVQCLGNHRFGSVGNLAAQERHRGFNGTFELHAGAAVGRYQPLDGGDVHGGAGDLQGNVALPGTVRGGSIPVLHLGHLKVLTHELTGDLRQPRGGQGPDGRGAECAGKIAVNSEGFQGAAHQLADVALEILVHQDSCNAGDGVRKGGGCAQGHGSSWDVGSD